MRQAVARYVGAMSATTPPKTRGRPRAEPSVAYLLHRLVVRIEQSANERAKPYGLRIQGVRVLRRLWVEDHQRLNDLAESTSIDPSTLSHLVKRLVRDGWLARRRSVDDDRSVIVSLSADGRRFVAATDHIFLAYDRVALRGFSAAERARLKNALQRAYRNIRRLDDEVPAVAASTAPVRRGRASAPRTSAAPGRDRRKSSE